MNLSGNTWHKSMMPDQKVIQLALLTAAAASIQIVENLVMRILPLPFIRIGLSNVVILYLIWKGRPFSALTVNIAKSLLGGLATFTLLSPGTLLSLCGGLAAILVMLSAKWLRMGLSLFGISILGAIAHNLAQLVLVRFLLISSDRVFMLTPILISIALLSGSVIAYITYYLDTKFTLLGMEKNEKLLA